MSSLRPISLLGAALVLIGGALTAQSSNATIHDLATMTPWALGKLQVKGAIGKHSSLALVEMPAGMKQGPHYHEQEQIVFGLGGSADVSISGRIHPHAALLAAFTPPNAEHFSANDGTGSATYIEFQPILRADWFPPHPKVALSRSPQPMVVPAEQKISADFRPTSSGWQSDIGGARWKSLSAEAVRVTVWDMSAAKAPVTIGRVGSARERFVYVIDGQSNVTVGANRQDLKKETLAVFASVTDEIQLASAGPGTTLVAVFDVIR